VTAIDFSSIILVVGGGGRFDLAGDTSSLWRCAVERNAVANEKSAEQPDDLETIINDLAAEQAVFRITLQCVLLSFFAAQRQMGPQALAELKAAVARSIDLVRVDPHDKIGGVRWKQLATSHAEQLFLELDDAMERTLKEGPQSAPH
jgi:hypothetical protein